MTFVKFTSETVTRTINLLRNRLRNSSYFQLMRTYKKSEECINEVAMLPRQIQFKMYSFRIVVANGYVLQFRVVNLDMVHCVELR
ncbi:hypothetical protein B566_EDAN008188 [Ephemera danica]|nr:hypothetical protein B566_EDAN008188 [Ephemera danica]